MIPAEDNPQAVASIPSSDSVPTSQTGAPPDVTPSTTDTAPDVTPSTTDTAPAAPEPTPAPTPAPTVAAPVQSPLHPDHPAHIEVLSRMQTIEAHALRWGGDVGLAIRNELGHLRNLLGL